MPRGPRVDILDGLYHVIARGVERRDIFRTDRDREDFLNRLAVVVEEEDLRLFAFVGGQILGTEHFARRALKGSRREELQREMHRDAATDLPALADEVARAVGLDTDRLHGSFRDRRAAACRSTS